MPRQCTVCASDRRAAIDAALVAGGTLRDIARQFSVGKDALARHKADHIPAAISEAEEARREARALDVVAQLKTINEAALSILKDARKLRDADTQLKAIDRIYKQIELQAKLLGELSDAPQVNLLIAPDWLAVRALLLATLAPYPEAKIAVAAALSETDGDAHAA